MIPPLDELIGESINKKAAYRDVPLSLPCSHHTAQPYKVSIARIVPCTNCQYFRFGICCAPLPSTVCVRESKGSGSIAKNRNYLKCYSIFKGNLNYLPVGTDA